MYLFEIERSNMMAKKALLGLLIMLISMPLFSQECRIPTDKTKFKIVLLVGQSNMAGRGFIQAEDKIPAQRVLTMNKKGEWVPSIEPTHFDKGGAGTCLGRTFAVKLAESDPTITVGLVPAACGGSSLNDWQSGQFFKQTNSYPFDDALARTKKALEVGTLTAILWHQGESDCNKRSAELHHDQLLKLFQTFRREFNAPNVPIIIGALYPRNNKYQDMVTDAQKKVAEESVPAAYVDDVSDLTLNPDNIHFDRKSLIRFGNSYFEKYQELTKNKTSE